MRLKFCLFIGFCFVVLVPARRAFGQLSTDSTALPVTGHFAKVNDLFFDAVKAKAHNDVKKAIELYEQFVSAEPQEGAPGYYELSKLYLEEKKMQKSEDNILKALALVKYNKWYNEQYASVLAVLGRYDEAAKQMATIADKETSDVNYAIMAAEYFDKAKKYSDAVQYIDRALVKSGQDDEILMKKVQLYLHMNDIGKAGDVVKQLIAQDPRNGKYYKLLGELYDNNKMPDKALQVYKDAEKAVPGDPAIELGLQEHYLNLKDTVKFRVYARKAIENSKLDVETQLELFDAYIQTLPDSTGIREGLQMLQNLLSQHPVYAPLVAIHGKFLEADKQTDNAIAEYKRSLAMKQSSYAVWQDLLNIYAEKQYSDSLIKYSEKAIKLFPNNALSHYYNGVGHYNKKNYPKAANALKRAIDLLPDTDAKTLAGMYAFLGDVYNSSKQFEESDKAFDKALELEPGDATVLNNYSYYLSERGKNLDKAKTMSERSLKLRPNETTFLDTYGWILYKNGEFAKAKEYIEKAVSANDKKADATLYEHLGDVYFKLNNKAKAVEYWKIAKEKGSENPLLPKKISEEKLYE